MKAVLYSAPRAFDVTELPDPEPKRGEARIRVELTGICGTDLHIHEGRFISRFPLTPGHEVVGVIDALGPDTEGPAPGTRVVPNGNAGCGRCAQCVCGRPLLCADFTALGVTGPGGFAEYMIAPASQCFPTEELAVEQAVLAEPTACAVHGMDVLELRAGAEALLLGSGPTGLVIAQLLARGGAARVTVASPSRFKLDLALELGADRVVEIPRTDQREAVARLLALEPTGFDVVVDATGSAAVSEASIALARDGGTVLWYGVTREDQRAAISPFEVFRRELTIKGSFAQVDCFPRAVQLLRTGRVRTDGVVTHRFALDEYGAALDAARSEPSCLKAVVAPV